MLSYLSNITAIKSSWMDLLKVVIKMRLKDQLPRNNKKWKKKKWRKTKENKEEIVTEAEIAKMEGVNLKLINWKLN